MKLSNAARAGNAPDVATIEYPQVPGSRAMASHGDITDLVTDRLRRELLPQALRLTTFVQRVFTLPLDGSRWCCTTARTCSPSTTLLRPPQ